jgi:hypothetical protein
VNSVSIDKREFEKRKEWIWYIVPSFDPRKLEMESKKSEGKKMALLAPIASHVGIGWLLKNCNRDLVPLASCQLTGFAADSME